MDSLWSWPWGGVGLCTFIFWKGVAAWCFGSADLPSWQVQFGRACQRLELGAIIARFVSDKDAPHIQDGMVTTRMTLHFFKDRGFWLLLGGAACFLNDQRNQLGVSLSVAQGMQTLREARTGCGTAIYYFTMLERRWNKGTSKSQQNSWIVARRANAKRCQGKLDDKRSTT